MSILLQRHMMQQVASAAPTSFTDDFNRADEALETNAKWSKLNSTGQYMDIVSNQLFASTTTNFATTAYYEYDETLPNNQYAEIEYISDTGTSVLKASGVACRMTNSGADAYLAQVRTAGGARTIRLTNRSGGSNTTLGTYTWTTAASGDLVRLICDGTSISVTVNGSTVLGPFTNSDNTAGKAGFASYIDLDSQSMTFDNFECGEV